MVSIVHSVIYQPSPTFPRWTRLTGPPPERREVPPEERGQIGKWLKFADVALNRAAEKHASWIQPGNRQAAPSAAGKMQFRVVGTRAKACKAACCAGENKAR